MSKKSVSFHDEPPATGRYTNAITRAKQASRDRPTAMEGTPRFDQLPDTPKGPPPGVEQKEQLSDNTAAGLGALAKAQEVHQQERLQEEAELAEVTEEEDEFEGMTPDEIREKKLRTAIEERLAAIDISPYFVGGSVMQVVPIIEDKFVVRYRTVTDLEETFVDNELVEEGEISPRQFLRRTNEWALATHIDTLNGTKWPAIFDGDGTINEKAMRLRMQNVRKLHTPVFNMLVSNLQWFLDRVNSTLTVEVLGNG
jgi:hypothetical protein